MLRRLGDLLASSIGRKAIMAVTGLLLVGFLITHLAGNLYLFVGQDGQAIDAYSAKLKSFGPLLYVAEVLLAALFLVHLYLAVRVTLENRRARAGNYQRAGSRGAKTLASSSMWFSGALVLGFLLKHLWDFRLDSDFDLGPARLIKQVFSSPISVGAYVLGLAAVGLHLSHGIRSAFQSLGLQHPAYNALLVRAGGVLAVVLAIAFASLPLLIHFGHLLQGVQ